MNNTNANSLLYEEDESELEEVEVKRKSGFVEVLKRLSKNKAAMVGLVILIVLILLAILAPVLTPYDYDRVDVTNAYKAPSLKHPLGTDELGRDMLTRILYGGRYSLSLGILVIFFGMLGGVVIGSIAGFFGGIFDTLLMRFCDILQSIPGMVLNLAMFAILGEGFVNCIIALSITRIAESARMMRASILKVRGNEYIEASSMANCSSGRIIIKHVIPNSLSPLIVQATMGIGQVILQAASLSYLGMGVQPPLPEWGAMLSEGRNYIWNYPYMTVFPGVVIMITVLSLNLLGDGLRDALDPKLKK